MITDYQIPEPFLFNPLKHHLEFIKEFLDLRVDDDSDDDLKNLLKELKHLGTSVMDVYTGSISVNNVYCEVRDFLKMKDLLNKKSFSEWAGINMNDFRLITFTDGSQWTLKYYDNNLRYIHIFPARGSQHTFRVKSNTLKSAMIYYILIGKDFITGDDLNRARTLLNLSPVKDSVVSEALTEMIEILRG